jgi:hypothetical protein
MRPHRWTWSFLSSSGGLPGTFCLEKGQQNRKHNLSIFVVRIMLPVRDVPILIPRTYDYYLPRQKGLYRCDEVP